MKKQMRPVVVLMMLLAVPLGPAFTKEFLAQDFAGVNRAHFVSDHVRSSMIVDDLHVPRTVIPPSKANSSFGVEPNAVLATQVDQIHGAVEHLQHFSRDALAIAESSGRELRPNAGIIRQPASSGAAAMLWQCRRVLPRA